MTLEREVHHTLNGDPEKQCSVCGVTYDISDNVVAADKLPEGKVNDPVLVLPEGVEDDGSLRLFSQLTEGNAADNSITYDVSLMDVKNHHVALPGECLLILPYPGDLNESNLKDYSIVIRHIRTDGTVDVFESRRGGVLALEQGIGIHVDSLSPFKISWEKLLDSDTLPLTGDNFNLWLHVVSLAFCAFSLNLLRRNLQRP
ncbi:MAG: hypothetical protein IKK21_05125 [Clostridia bacterium]|nr:hypothetical protein [Clostridia bacterium]